MFRLIIPLCLLVGSPSFSSSVTFSDQHPGYWNLDGETTLLLGAWNHGHNPFLDHSTLDGAGYADSSSEEEILSALDELASSGGNLIRCVLDPGVAAGNQGFDFCKKIDGKYDLNQLEGPFWDRLDWFLGETSKRDIVVGLEIWDRFDWYDGGHQGWPGSPFNPRNNLNYSSETSGLQYQYTGKADHSENPFGLTTPGQTSYQNASDKQRAQFDLVRGYQETFIRHLLSITFEYDHVLYSANNEVRHQEPAWGQYWIRFIRDAAKNAGKSVICTDMFWDLLHIPNSDGFEYQLNHLQYYDYLDVSQTTAQPNYPDLSPEAAGETHWEIITFAADKAEQADRLIHINKIYGSPSRTGGWMGSGQNAVEEFWRSLIAGAAGARFHRPDEGLGLSAISKHQIRVVRQVEKRIKFWDVVSAQELLSERDPNEAYLAADPGQAYLLYFPTGGTVKLDLEDYENTRFHLNWLSLSTDVEETSMKLEGGTKKSLNSPGNQGWIATVVRVD